MDRHYMNSSKTNVDFIKIFLQTRPFYPEETRKIINTIDAYIKEWIDTIDLERTKTILQSILLEGRKFVEVLVASILKFDPSTAHSTKSESAEGMINYLESISKKTMKNGRIPHPMTPSIIPPIAYLKNNKSATTPLPDKERPQMLCGIVHDVFYVCAAFRSIKYYGNIVAHSKKSENMISLSTPSSMMSMATIPSIIPTAFPVFDETDEVICNRIAVPFIVYEMTSMLSAIVTKTMLVPFTDDLQKRYNELASAAAVFNTASFPKRSTTPSSRLSGDAMHIKTPSPSLFSASSSTPFSSPTIFVGADVGSFEEKEEVETVPIPVSKEREEIASKGSDEFVIPDVIRTKLFQKIKE